MDVADLRHGSRWMCWVNGRRYQDCALVSGVAEREERVSPTDASACGIAGEVEPDGGFATNHCHGDDLRVVLFYLYFCVLAVADVHGHRTGGSVRPFGIQYW